MLKLLDTNEHLYPPLTAELKAAELTKVWSLSNREKQIISNLNNRENH